MVHGGLSGSSDGDDVYYASYGGSVKIQTILFITSVMLALLMMCACTNIDGDETDTSKINEPAFTLPLPSLNDPDGIGEDKMPEYWYLADEKFDTDEFLPEYDIPLTYVGEYTFRQLYSYEDTIYTYTATDTYDGFITVTDKETYESEPLCTVSGCAHAGEGCEAYIYGAVYGLRVYDSMLYWVQGIYDPSSAISLVRCNLDGTGREVVWSYDMYNNEYGFNFLQFFNSMAGSFHVLIHRGYIYFAGLDFFGINAACMPLEGGKPTVLAGGAELGGGVEGLDSVSCRICVSGNDIYVMTNHMENACSDGIYLYYDHVKFYRIDTKNRTLTELGGATGEMLGLTMTSFDENAFCVVPDDGIYFFERYEYYVNDSVDKYDSTATLCKLSFDTGEVERVAKLCDGDFDSFFHVGFGDGVAEAHSLGNMYIFDLSGTLISKREFLMEYDYPCVDVIGADADNIYFSCKASGERFCISAPADGGDIDKFSAYTMSEHEYTEVEFMNNHVSGEFEVSTENGDVTLDYGADVNNFMYFSFHFYVNGSESIPGVPVVYDPSVGVAHSRTNHGYENTDHEVRSCTRVALNKLTHIMHSKGRYAELSCYFCGSEVISLMFSFEDF